jgi:hypothetical protein
MAKVLGDSGRYVTQEAVRQRLRTFSFVCICISLLSIAEGFVLSGFLPPAFPPTWAKLPLSLAVIASVYALWRWGNRHLDALEKRRLNMLRGATGEAVVGSVLGNLPDDYCIINDLTTPFGNLDHVVIGPTGVYLLDTKNWRGVITANGSGELLLNGKPSEKPAIKPFVGRVMSIKEKVRTLTSGLDPFFQAAFVFTSARVEARWGTTGSVHCVTDDQLYEYIVEKKFGKRLSPAEVQSIAQAFLGLAHMDREFAKPQSTRPS